MDIKKIRRKLMMTQKEFAKTLNVSRASVSYWESNAVEISISSLRKLYALCKERGIEVDW